MLERETSDSGRETGGDDVECVVEGVEKLHREDIGVGSNGAPMVGNLTLSLILRLSKCLAKAKGSHLFCWGLRLQG